jgi:ribose transport system permease protein
MHDTYPPTPPPGDAPETGQQPVTALADPDLPDQPAAEQPSPTVREPIGSWALSLARTHADRLGLLALGVAIVLTFGIWTPDTFLTWTTLKLTLSDMAITGILSLGLMIPLSASAFDLSIGWTLALSASLVSALMVQDSVPPGLAILLGLAAGLAIGLVNAILVVRIGIDSFIATLGTSSILSALTVIVSGNAQIFGLPSSFTKLAAAGPLGISWAVVYLIVLAVGVWFVLEQTPLGRYLFATGGNREAARLAGVRTSRLIFASFLFSGLVAALAGVVLAAQVGGSSPDFGNTYLLAAFAVCFFGATQVRSGRQNVVGMVTALFVLTLGTEGFSLVTSQPWVQDFFYGAALVAAVAIGKLRARGRPRTAGLETPGSGS